MLVPAKLNGKVDKTSGSLAVMFPDIIPPSGDASSFFKNPKRKFSVLENHDHTSGDGPLAGRGGIPKTFTKKESAKKIKKTVDSQSVLPYLCDPAEAGGTNAPEKKPPRG